MYIIRPIEFSDFSKKYLQLLEQLTDVNIEQITQDKFNSFISNLGNDHMIYVIVDAKIDIIVGSGTCFIEHKIIHGISKVGHIEDIVVDKNYRKQGLGNMMIDELVNFAKLQQCYKVILNCSEENSKFYEKCGLIKKEVEMVKYF